VVSLSDGLPYDEKELSDSIDLCDSKGLLRDESIGWSRNPIFNCNLSGRWPRKKKWNYWCISNSECLFSITISNLDYAVMVFAYFLDLKTKKFIEKTLVVPFARGCTMPDKVHGNIYFKHPGMEIRFTEEDKCTHITASSTDFGGEPMSVDFRISYPEGQETLNVVIPWSKNTFQFTSKQECLPVSGSLSIGNTIYSLKSQNTFGCLDFGRGIWPRKISWNWANASGKVDGHLIGINLGGKWTDGTGMTENALLIDGKIIKLSEDIIFTYDTNDYMKPWHLKTSITDSVDLEFVPDYERIASTNLVIIKSSLHQMVGHFSGSIKAPSGEAYALSNMMGWSEEHFALW
jgi:hypothetical protein